MVRLFFAHRIGHRGNTPQSIWVVIRAICSVALVGLFVWMLSQRLSHINWDDVSAGFAGVSLMHWLAAMAATAMSFWAVGHYDAVLHRHFATGLPDAQTRRAGICAIAISQTIGLGLITGAVVRWRMLPGQSLLAATRLTAAVAISFLAGWAVVTAAVLATLPDAPFKPGAAAVLTLALGLCAVCLAYRPTTIRLPNGITLLRLLILCAVDTFAAAMAFYLLCPAGLGLPFLALLPAFLVALGAGLASGPPGGVGAFEITVLALLPSASAPALLAAILAWRVVYYALPAVLGAGLALRGPIQGPTAQAKPDMPQSDCANFGRVPHVDPMVLPAGAGEWPHARTPHFLVGLFNHAARAHADDFANLSKIAHAESRLPALYHIPARAAVLARRSGFALLRVAQEAWLSPASYRVAAPPRAGLRRKLRRAQAAGVAITCPHPAAQIPWPQLDHIAQSWSVAHGTERGFSMGRYTRGNVRRQRLYIASANGIPTAFVTFHQRRDEWVLDLMRYGPNTPDGAMQLLVHTAILEASAQGIARLSLAAVPDIVIGRRGGLLHRLIAAATRKQSQGLLQFKSSFAPRWRAVYLAAPSPFALPLAGAEIAREVFWPKSLPAPAPHASALPPPACHAPASASPADCRSAYQHEDYEFASDSGPWHRRAE